MSVSILERRKAYYAIVESTQQGALDITPWLLWFLDTLNDAIQHTLNSIEQTTAKTQFWRRVDQRLLTPALTTEQVKVLNRLLDGDFNDGISSSQYQKVAKVSAPPPPVIWPCLLNRNVWSKLVRVVEARGMCWRCDFCIRLKTV